MRYRCFHFFIDSNESAPLKHLIIMTAHEANKAHCAAFFVFYICIFIDAYYNHNDVFLITRYNKE